MTTAHANKELMRCIIYDMQINMSVADETCIININWSKTAFLTSFLLKIIRIWFNDKQVRTRAWSSDDHSEWLVGCFMVFNAIFNNITVISWRSVLLVEEIGENHRLVASHWQTLSHNVVSSTPHHERDSNSQLQWW